MWKKLVSEGFGTFSLVFAGTGAIIVNDATGLITHVGIAITFGLVVLSMILAIGGISGAHMNPAVTIAFVFTKQLPISSTIPYVISQIMGALAASLLLSFIFPAHHNLGATIPSGPIIQSFLLEIFLSMILMFVILRVSTGPKEQGIIPAIAVGSVITLEALIAGPVSGASMNPARSAAPAIVSMRFNHLWIYIVAPVTGMFLAALLEKILNPVSSKSAIRT